MPDYKGFVLSIKAEDNGYTPLYPETTKDQVIGWNIGEVYGPYSLTLSASNWVNKQQIVNLNGVTSNTIVFCTNVLSGDQSNMINQENAYALLDPKYGIESLNNQLKFTCTNAVPEIDINVQVWWRI